jgi:UDP-N-acetylmuramate dehydrogenase
MNIIKLFDKVKCGKKLENISLKDYTTYKIDGKAVLLLKPSNVEELNNILKVIRDNNLKYKILGKGSNIIFVSPVYEGVLISLEAFDNLEIKGNKIIVGAGYSLLRLALKVSHLGLTGLEFATGIPGTVGGAVYMNAGAYNTDMGYIVKEVKVLTPEYEVKTLTNKDLEYHYRSSYLQTHPELICLEATMTLKQGDKKAIEELIQDRKRRRMETQPLEYPSAGSVFRNPPNDNAWRLVEAIGYKGKKIGNAMVSEKHANFIIGLGPVKGEDIKKLIMEIKEKVKNQYDIDLKVEQEIVD